jgi:hypothetical protein
MKKPFVLLLIFSQAIAGISAQDAKSPLTVKVDQIISKDFPSMTVYAVVENDKGEVSAGFAPGLFSFRIDSMEVTARTSIVPFSLKEVPIDYSIIFSNNGIMDGEPLDFQKNAVLQFIELMKESDQLSLYTIGEEAAVIFEEQKKAAIDLASVNGVVVSLAQPRVYDSIINVMRKVQRRRIERKVVIVISDGRDQNSRFTKDQLNTVLTEVGVPVYALGMRILTSQTLSNLNEIADLTGGTYVYASRVADVPKSLKSLHGRMTQPYIINLKIRNMKADNLPHVLEVAVNERDSAGRGQKTFVAVKVPVPRWVYLVLIIVAVVVIAGAVVIFIILRIQKRKSMGITRRRCPECHNLLKDSWDSCPFCKYVPDIKKKPKRKKK